MERQEHIVLKDMYLDRRFPFIAKSKQVGSGGSGIVSKQIIAPGYLKTNHNTSVNHKPRAVAVKVVPEKSVCEHEFINLKSLQRSLTNHHHIMVNLATIVRDLPVEGKMYYIIYDLADMDLEKFLTSPWAENRRDRNNNSPRGRNHSYQVWPGELIKQIRHLADALDFLHNRMFDLERITLVHNDLKPPNILVFYPNSADKDQRYPVGQWKIADFGLGKVKDSRDTRAEPENRLPDLHLHPNASRPSPRITDITHRQLSLTPAKRPPGRYTPPEVKEDGKGELNAKMGDVWAFGTVFSEVLAYAVEEVYQVKTLREACQSTDDRFFDPDTGELKKAFLDWMSQLLIRPEKDGRDVLWIQECIDLIKKVLVKDASNRMVVAIIRDELDRIYRDCLEPKKEEWLSDIQDDNRPPSLGSIDSPHEYDQEDYFRSPSSDTSRRGSSTNVPAIHETRH